MIHVSGFLFLIAPLSGWRERGETLYFSTIISLLTFSAGIIFTLTFGFSLYWCFRGNEPSPKNLLQNRRGRFKMKSSPAASFNSYVPSHTTPKIHAAPAPEV